MSFVLQAAGHVIDTFLSSSVMGKIDQNNTKLLPLFDPSTKYLPSIKISYFDDNKEVMGSSDMSTPSPQYTALPRASTDAVNDASLLRPSESEQSTIPDEGLTIYLSQVLRAAAASFALIPFIIYIFRLNGGTIAAIVFLAIVLAEHIISLLVYLLSNVRFRIELRGQPVQLPSATARVARSPVKWERYSDCAMAVALLIGVCATGHRGNTGLMVGIGFHWASFLVRVLLALGSFTKRSAWFNVYIRCGMGRNERLGDE